MLSDHIIFIEVLEMAKTIKFNLLCNGKSVRNLEDFRNNFNVEDVIRYYNNGILMKWLEVRGYTKELEEIMKIDYKDQSELILSLARIFEMTDDVVDIKKNMYIYTYEKELRTIMQEQFIANKNYNDVIDYYHNKYDSLIQDIVANKTNKSIIKASVAILVNDYTKLLEIDAERVFNLFFKDSPLALYTMLTYDFGRTLFLGNELFQKKLNDNIDSISARKLLVSQTDNNVKIYQNITDHYWKDLVGKGTKVLIIYMGDGTYVRSSGKIGEEISSQEAVKNFVVLDGLDYKNNNIENELLYMEV